MNGTQPSIEPIVREIEAAIAERGLRLDAIERVDATFANLRLGVAALVLATGVAALALDSIWAWGLPVEAVAFFVLVFRHADVLRRKERVTRALSFHERRHALVRNQWAGTGSIGERFEDGAHGYAADLDLFGRGSIFDLSCAARTWLGEDACAAWLLSAATSTEIRERQEAVRELERSLEFREALWVAAEPEVHAIDPRPLLDWARAPARIEHRNRVRFTAVALSIFTSTALALRFAENPWGGRLLGPALLVHAAFLLGFRKRADEATSGLDRADALLATYRESLEAIEGGSFESELLKRGRAALAPSSDARSRASRRVRKLHRIVEWLDNLHDFYLGASLGPLLLWKLQCALALEDWRETSGRELERWLARLGEFDALSGFAALAETHPGWAWPEPIDGGAPRIEAEDLGHPLLAPESCVRNDLRLGGETALMLVSGSNMSGKSTWLRSVGSAAVMAQAGAPVCARAMRMSSLRVVTSLRVVDSLADGASHFLAEVKRLKHALDVAETGAATLFLFDEILHGTNSRERAIGARALVRRLVERHAIGLVTTHDLALVALADELGARAVKSYFADHVEDGRMLFDYKLRPGVLATTNALAVMRSVGIDLDFQEV